MSNNVEQNHRPDYDQVIQDIADYALSFNESSAEALETARYCLMDTLGCGFLALKYQECSKHLGPIVEGTMVPFGVRVPGTSFKLDPVKAAWDIGCIIRWLDFNDTWLAAEWGHPSDNLGGILAISDHLAQKQLSKGESPITMRAVLEAMVMAHEIQGCLALDNSFNKVGLDHVVLVKVASTAVVAKLQKASREQMLSALSHAWVDGQSLRTYRHAPNAGSRKSWAAGDATSRAVRLVDIAMRGEMGIPGVLTAPQWGFYDVLFSKNNKDQSLKSEKQRIFSFQRAYDTYVMENILFKISFPAEFHAQTACEAAVKLHPTVKNRLEKIERIELTTHESAIRIISKSGPLANAADRDHCLQYMVAITLLFGDLSAGHYEDQFHKDHPEIDQLRDKMKVSENKRYSDDYLNTEKRSIANAVQIFYVDGTSSEKIEVEYPVGHKCRREEGIPLLKDKFKRSLNDCFPKNQAEKIYTICNDQKQLDSLAVSDFMEMMVI